MKEYVLFTNDYTSNKAYEEIIKVKKLNRNKNTAIIKLKLWDEFSQKYIKVKKLVNINFKTEIPIIYIGDNYGKMNKKSKKTINFKWTY